MTPRTLFVAVSIALYAPVIGFSGQPSAQPRGQDDGYGWMEPWQHDQIRDIDARIRQAYDRHDRDRARRLEEQREQMVRKFRRDRRDGGDRR